MEWADVLTGREYAMMGTLERFAKASAIAHVKLVLTLQLLDEQPVLMDLRWFSVHASLYVPLRKHGSQKFVSVLLGHIVMDQVTAMSVISSAHNAHRRQQTESLENPVLFLMGQPVAAAMVTI
jgi:hypothetical protein